MIDLNNFTLGGGPAEDRPDLEGLTDIVVQYQEGINMLTEILGEHKARIEKLEMEVRRVKARTDAPVKSNILRVN